VNVRRSADVTSYPVENGATVSDHVQIKNNKFSLKGRITETPIKSDPGLLKSAGVNGNRRSLAIDYLNQIMDSRQPFLLVTENKTFENVVLTGIEYTEEASESLVFDLSFEQIRLVSYGTVNTVALKTQPSKNIGANMKKRVNTEKSSSEGEDTITPAFKQE
ncbi:phage baseplate protein, partial [Escherichia coli]